MSRPILSREAKVVLMSTGTNRVGSRVYCPDPAVWAELKDAGMIRDGGGLTRAGSIVRERHVTALLDELFPL